MRWYYIQAVAASCFTPSYAFWKPTDMASGLEYWFDAANTCSMAFELDGQSVNQWNDQSGNGRNVTNLSTGNFPKTNVTIVNTYNVMDFVSSGGGTAFMGNNGITINQPDTVVTFGRATNNNGGYTDSYNLPQHVFYNQGERLAAGTLLNAGNIIDSNYHINGAEFNGASSKIYSDAVQIASGNANTNNMNGIMIGRFRLAVGASAVVFLDGSIGDVIIFSGVDTAKRQLCEGYLSWKWAGDGSYLPIGHPYKSTPP